MESQLMHIFGEKQMKADRDDPRNISDEIW
jgi:hypothetical protein